MIIGYQFINKDGYPIGNVQPTLEAAEDCAKFEVVGHFYSVNLDSDNNGTLFLCYIGKQSDPVIR